jgi:hypothetical protein
VRKLAIRIEVEEENRAARVEAYSSPVPVEEVPLGFGAAASVILAVGGEMY